MNHQYAIECTPDTYIVGFNRVCEAPRVVSYSMVGVALYCGWNSALPPPTKRSLECFVHLTVSIKRVLLCDISVSTALQSLFNDKAKASIEYAHTKCNE